MAKEEPTPFTRECAWTGEDFEGKGYIIQTTEGFEVVSAAAFLAPWQPPAKKAPAVKKAPDTTPPTPPTDPSA